MHYKLNSWNQSFTKVEAQIYMKLKVLKFKDKVFQKGFCQCNVIILLAYYFWCITVYAAAAKNETATTFINTWLGNL